jgi:NodT family efflux transporter outer membrane factor (OMF) lipoprotein
LASAAGSPQAPSSAAAGDLAHWWRAFGDPTLSALVADALAANTDIAVAQARLRAAAAQRDAVAAALWPTVGVRGTLDITRIEGQGTSQPAGARLVASWEPDLWGGTRAGVETARQQVRASAATLGSTQVQVAAEVALAYIDLRSLQARLAIGLTNLDSQVKTLQLTRWRLQAGLVTQLDVEQALTAVEQTRSQVPALEAAIRDTRNTLAVLLGQPPGALDGALEAPAAVPAPPDALALAFPAEALRQRPDVAAAEAQVLAATAAVEQADARRLPTLSLGGTLGYSALTLYGFGAATGVASLAAAVSAPLFDAGLVRAQVQQQEAQVDAARGAYRATLLGALQDVEAALTALQRTREQLAAQRAAADAARRAAQLAEWRYASGLIDFQPVLQTQRTQLTLDDAVVASSGDLAAQHVRLYRALGGGWTPLDADAVSATRPPAATP